MARMTPSPDVEVMMMNTTQGAANPAVEDEVKADDLCQASERVQPGTKKSRSRSRSSSSEDPTRYT
jgi:hypothetical protein